jgi:hypothetical protein
MDNIFAEDTDSAAVTPEASQRDAPVREWIARLQAHKIHWMCPPFARDVLQLLWLPEPQQLIFAIPSIDRVALLRARKLHRLVGRGSVRKTFDDVDEDGDVPAPIDGTPILGDDNAVDQEVRVILALPGGAFAGFDASRLRVYSALHLFSCSACDNWWFSRHKHTSQTFCRCCAAFDSSYHDHSISQPYSDALPFFYEW